MMQLIMIRISSFAIVLIVGHSDIHVYIGTIGLIGKLHDPMSQIHPFEYSNLVCYDSIIHKMQETVIIPAGNKLKV